LINTGGSVNLAHVLECLSPEALEEYLPFKAVRVNQEFTKVLNGRFYKNCTIEDATKRKEREILRQRNAELKMARFKESLDKETIQIAKLQRR